MPRKRLSVDPAFDPITKTWFVQELGAEAPSIPALLKLLPKGTVIENYYPNGYSGFAHSKEPASALRPRFGGSNFVFHRTSS